MSLTARDIYDALADQLVGSCHYLGTRLDSGDLTSVTVDGEVDCVALAEFLNRATTNPASGQGPVVAPPNERDT